VPRGRLGVFATGWLAGMAVWVAAAAGVAAVEVWMPETGEVKLEEPPGDDVAARRDYAYALIGAGEWKSGARELRRLIKRNPEAEWRGEARLMIGRALLSGGKYRKAFDVLAEVREAHPGTPLAQRARVLQHETAMQQTTASFGKGADMYDRLVETAPGEEEAATALVQKADATFNARFYLRAQDAYLAVVDLYPQSEWAPYCWHRIAECDLERASWLELGVQGYQAAERGFADFLEVYPENQRAPEARRKLEEIRRRLAALNVEVVRFYAEAEERPWAAIRYLEHIRDNLPGTPQSEWAEQELHRIEAELTAPPRGRVRRLPLIGVEQTPAGE